jgi:predicted HicB family RNase H-like nuclease
MEARLYTREIVEAPSPPVADVPSYRLSLRRVEDGDPPWLAEVEGFANSSSRAATPEEAARKAWSAVEQQTHEQADAERNGTPAASDRKHSGKILVRMPATLHAELARQAADEGVSLNQLITTSLASAVGWRSDDSPSRPSEPTGLDRLRGASALLVANIFVVAIAGVVAIALLVVALRG